MDNPSTKRPRVDSDDSPEVKRLRSDLLLDILDDDDAVTVDRDLADVMRSLEEEIALPATDPPMPEPYVAPGDHLPDLGYLLEASDDELGLPPSCEAEVEVVGGGGDEVEEAGFGRIWAIDDEIRYDAPVFAGDEGDDTALFDEGLFDYADVLCGPSDFSDATWRQESLPAV